MNIKLQSKEEETQTLRICRSDDILPCIYFNQIHAKCKELTVIEQLVTKRCKIIAMRLA